ncbi:hypothetical protein P152DRAFT_5603 [Eremomyces bilateralis CBS 781.70]|uniref:Uncharacterized protein n=1 Tax=Eremomyces bilateralis CBS 781.70 TaxID=1392243 RepID=A0A6G1GGI9_9PEZI|nr:uncharacterized protein P152DRAFT_5603 [Eremomyces bilateralis CBS 781.70]KAF1816989.1 hypothetical protein P152DRAFT_5603 [Eremomyces bilateralis CBS 781.70]
MVAGLVSRSRRPKPQMASIPWSGFKPLILPARGTMMLSSFDSSTRFIPGNYTDNSCCHESHAHIFQVSNRSLPVLKSSGATEIAYSKFLSVTDFSAALFAISDSIGESLPPGPSAKTAIRGWRICKVTQGFAPVRPRVPSRQLQVATAADGRATRLTLHALRRQSKCDRKPSPFTLFREFIDYSTIRLPS